MASSIASSSAWAAARFSASGHHPFPVPDDHRPDRCFPEGRRFFRFFQGEGHKRLVPGSKPVHQVTHSRWMIWMTQRAEAAEKKALPKVTASFFRKGRPPPLPAPLIRP